MLVYQRIDVPTAGLFIKVPSQFQTNLIIGFTDFSTSKTDTTFTFMLDFMTISGSYGINAINVAIRNMPTRYVQLLRGGFTLFYLKTWLCPTGLIFNKLSDMC